jgi:ketosteroid isomerase-like protein
LHPNLKIIIMKQFTFPLLLLMLTLTITSKGQSKKDSQLEEAKKAIAKSNAIYHQSTAKNDSSIFLNSYAIDACVLPPNAPMVCGREALAKFFRAGYEIGIRGGQFTTTNVYGDGNGYVTEEGTGQVYDVNGKVYDDFKYLVLWKKTKDGWKMYRDSFSSNKYK